MTPTESRSDLRAPEILRAAQAGDRRMLARAISLLEDGQESMRAALASATPQRSLAPGRPHVVGLSGPPGSGKSSLVDRLIRAARIMNRKVAVLAVDPSSPFSGGAILGDRVRMLRHSEDSAVFVRSLSSRGHLGGLSLATGQVVELLDICGWDTVLLETVGVGQSEIAVMGVADSVAVVLTPESGDTVQTMKAGLLEIADVFVVNKADRPGAAALARELSLSVELDDRSGWKAPVLLASAMRNEGIERVLQLLDQHLAWCRDEGLEQWNRRRAQGRMRTCLDMVALKARGDALDLLDGSMSSQASALAKGATNPYDLSTTLYSTIKSASKLQRDREARQPDHEPCTRSRERRR